MRVQYAADAGEQTTHGGEAHVLDVVELVHQALPAASAELLEVAVAARTIFFGEAVDDDLVDGPGTPLVGAGCNGGASERECRKEGLDEHSGASSAVECSSAGWAISSRVGLGRV